MYSNRSGRLTAFAIFFWFAGAVSLEASPMTVEWDANSEPDLAGYVVYYGTASGVYTVNVDVGNQTSWQVNLVDGQSYYFAVKAYDSEGLYSVFSNEVSAVAGEPFLTNPGDQSAAEGVAITLALVASDPGWRHAELQRAGPAAGPECRRGHGRHHGDGERRGSGWQSLRCHRVGLRRGPDCQHDLHLDGQCDQRAAGDLVSRGSECGGEHGDHVRLGGERPGWRHAELQRDGPAARPECRLWQRPGDGDAELHGGRRQSLQCHGVGLRRPRQREHDLHLDGE